MEAVINDDIAYVAVGKDFEESKQTLLWALDDFYFKKICLLHVHIPATKIIPSTNSSDQKHELEEFQKLERKIMHRILDGYLTMCSQEHIPAEKICIEKDDIGKGIIELINKHKIKKLVMGAAADKHYSEGMKDLMSSKAKYVERHLPESCHVWYICKRRLIFTRVGESSCSSIALHRGSASAIEQRTEGSELALQLYEVPQLEESSRRIEVAKTSIKEKALESLYTSELKRRKESEEALVKEKEAHQRLKNLLEEAKLNAKDHILLCQILAADMDTMRIELKAEQEKVLKLTKELANKQAENTSGLEMHEFLSVFSLSDIQRATRDFDSSLKIGQGGYGKIYKGFLHRTPVAIKVLDGDSMQGPSEFNQEVRILSKMRHPNLVTLIGACADVCAMVYEYMPSGNLEDRLRCKNNTPPLPWQARIRIATELCSALIFLHSSNPYSIVHGDLKPANVLLDANFVCKLSDFGICRALPRDITLCHQTDPKGTYLYLDPHFIATGQLTPKSDIYSFGIILLQLLTGRSPFGIVREINSVMDEGNLQSFLDPSAGDWPFVQAKQLARQALNCCSINPSSRPDLSEVWRVLEPMRASCGTWPPLQFDLLQNQNPPSYFCCPILLEVMKDPQVAADGFTYEAEAFTGWIESGHDTSPMTNLKLEHLNLIPNNPLRSAIQEWRDSRSSLS